LSLENKDLRLASQVPRKQNVFFKDQIKWAFPDLWCNNRQNLTAFIDQVADVIKDMQYAWMIRIRQPIASKRQFFDIGIAGPIAGFLVILPVLAIGMSQSTVVTLPENFVGWQFGEPLLFRLVARIFHGTLAEGQSLNVHPAGWAAWFGLLATALNLCPVSQLDGGHISYAVFGRASSAITLVVTSCMIGLTIYSGAYFLWTVLVVAMLYFMGRHHPRTSDEGEPLDATRLWLAVFAAAMLVLSFTPIPLIHD